MTHEIFDKSKTYKRLGGSAEIRKLPLENRIDVALAISEEINVRYPGFVSDKLRQINRIDMDPDKLIQRARFCYDSGIYNSSINYLTMAIEESEYGGGTQVEALILRAQAYKNLGEDGYQRELRKIGYEQDQLSRYYPNGWKENGSVFAEWEDLLDANLRCPNNVNIKMLYSDLMFRMATRSLTASVYDITDIYSNVTSSIEFQKIGVKLYTEAKKIAEMQEDKVYK